MSNIKKIRNKARDKSYERWKEKPEFINGGTEDDITKDAGDLARALHKKFPWLPIGGEYNLAKYIVFELGFRKEILK